MRRLEDLRLKKLRSLIDQAIQLRDAAEQLIAELTEQLHHGVSTSDDRGAPAERRRKPRP